MTAQGSFVRKIADLSDRSVTDQRTKGTLLILWRPLISGKFHKYRNCGYDSGNVLKYFATSSTFQLFAM